MQKTINFPAKRELLTGRLKEAEEARRVASLAELAGEGSDASVATARQRIQEIKDDLADLDSAEALWKEREADKDAAERRARHFQDNTAYNALLDERVSAATLADQALTELCRHITRMRDIETQLLHKSGGAFGQGQFSLNAAGIDQMIETRLVRAGMGTGNYDRFAPALDLGKMVADRHVQMKLRQPETEDA